MLFNSFPFLLLFLPIVLGGFFQIARFNHALAAGWLTAASLFFYAYWNPVYVGLLLASIACNYFFGLWIARSGRKSSLAISIAANLALLGYYKYANFFVENLAAASGASFDIGAIVLPLGISFFTFTQIAYLVDTYQGKVRERNFVHYTLFVSYFPHLIAGPVLHHKEMMPQFRDPATYRFSYENCAVGLTIFAIGLFKKVALADSISPYANAVFDAAHGGVEPSFLEAWFGALAYTLQLYFDFSGYSDMAIGLSRLFGIVLPVNFFSPYKATNIIEFWRRWHMTLSRFLRDYLYIPLGGNRKGPARRYLNLLVTMLLGGLWHGAGWTYVVWGALHGTYLLINHAFISFKQHVLGISGPSRWPARALGWLVTFVAVVVAWVFFRAADLQAAKTMLASMSGAGQFLLPHELTRVVGSAGVQALQRLGIGFANLPLLGGTRPIIMTVVLLAIAILLPNTSQIMIRYRPALALEQLASLTTRFTWRPAWAWVGFVAAISVTALLLMRPQSDFLYFQF